MKCQKCTAPLAIPGEPPGYFFIIFVVLLASGALGALLGYPLVGGFLLFASLFAAVATWINIGDSCSMASDGSALQGVRCKGCGHVNALRPWSR